MMRVDDLFPHVKGLWKWENYCKNLGLNKEGTRALFTMQPYRYTGELHSIRYNHTFKANDVVLQLKPDEDGPSGFRIHHKRRRLRCVVQTTTKGVLRENRNRHREDRTKTGNEDVATKRDGQHFGFVPFVFRSNRWPQIEITRFNVNIDFQKLFSEICPAIPHLEPCVFKKHFLILQCHSKDGDVLI